MSVSKLLLLLDKELTYFFTGANMLIHARIEYGSNLNEICKQEKIT